MKRKTWVESAMGWGSGIRNQSVRTSSIMGEGRSANIAGRRVFLDLTLIDLG
jgi:hypothetical protein